MNNNIDENSQELIDWVENDNFKNPNTKILPRNQILLQKLKKLKEEFMSFFLGSPLDHGETVFDIHMKAKRYYLQIARLRMVIEPEIQIAINTHSTTKISYLAAKGFWISNNGERIRKFTKLLGKIEQFPEGRKSVQAYKEGERQMQKIMWALYQKEYPDN